MMTRGFIMSTKLLDQVEQNLNNLFEKTGATCVMLIDVSGQLISYKGAAEDVDLNSLSALIASDMAAVTEMSKLIGERNKFKLRFHEGDTANVMISPLSGNFLLAVIFNPSVQIGLVRLYTKEVVTRVSKLVEQFETSDRSVAKIMDADFSSSLTDEMERAFSE